MTYEKYLADGFIHCQVLQRLALDKALALRGKSAAIQVLVARYNVAATNYRVAHNRSNSGYETPETAALKQGALEIYSQISGHQDVKIQDASATVVGENAMATYISPREAKAKRATATAFRRWERSEA